MISGGRSPSSRLSVGRRASTPSVTACESWPVSMKRSTWASSRHSSSSSVNSRPTLESVSPWKKESAPVTRVASFANHSNSWPPSQRVYSRRVVSPSSASWNFSSSRRQPARVRSSRSSRTGT